MGKILSRFRKNPSTLETLEKIDKEISVIQEYKSNTQQRQKKIVGLFILYSIVAYAVIALIFYLYYFPHTFKEQVLCITPFLIFPIIIWLWKKFLTFYYQRKIRKNEDKLVSLQRKKKAILDDVRAKETYNVAKDILEKYDPEHKRSLFPPLSKKSPLPRQPPASGTAGAYAEALASKTATSALLPSRPTRPIPTFSNPDQMELRRRHVLTSTASSVPPRPLIPALGSVGRLPILNHPQTHPRNGREEAPMGPPGPPMPRPVLPRERSMTDKMIEYLVGDGPNNRYALICQHCESHNGMALKEEFEYLAFRCCYCHNWNPARKQRPHAPRLPAGGTRTGGDGDLSSSSEEETEESGTGSEGTGSQSTSASVPLASTEDKEKENPEESSDAKVPSSEQPDGTAESTDAKEEPMVVDESESESCPNPEGHQGPGEDVKPSDPLGT